MCFSYIESYPTPNLCYSRGIRLLPTSVPLKGKMTDLNALYDAEDINNLGQIVGNYASPYGFHHAFLYSNGNFTALGPFGVEALSVAYAINDSGMIVGGATDSYNVSSHAFLEYTGVSGNQPPIAANDSAVTTEATAVNINVISNDTDLDGAIDPATVTITGAAGNGTTVPNVDGTVTYTPNTGFTGTDTFTYTVEDNEGALSNEATVTVTITPGGAYFYDDFSTNTTGDYTVTHTWTSGGYGQFLYDSAGQRARVRTGDNIGLRFSYALPALDTGTFSVDFLPTVKYPSGGWIFIRLVQDQNNYYEIYNTDGYGPKSVTKVINDLVVDSATFLNGYVQNTTYPITIDFSPTQTTVTAFGNVLTMNTNHSSIMVGSFEIEVAQQDAYFDSIVYTDN